MPYDVVVVGGGIGGLTTAALLAARGMGVCLVERESRAGGCCAAVECFGHRFEPGAGLYASWEPGEIHARVFSELHMSAPEVREVSPAYTLRLPGGFDVRVGGSEMGTASVVGGSGLAGKSDLDAGTDATVRFEEFASILREAFPECAEHAVSFYSEAKQLADALHRAASRVPSLATASRLERLRLIASEPRLAPRILASMNDTTARHLAGASTRFRRFVDAQLQIFAQVPSDECAYLYAAVALSQPLRGMYAMRGGAQALADSLAGSIKQSGGTLRFDSHALRLAFDSEGRAAGVTLLSGETVEARRAVVSNLTAWDTYGKLVGGERTPSAVKARLKGLRGWGAYQVFVSLDEDAARRLPSEQLLSLDDWQEGKPFDAQRSLFMLSTAPPWDSRAPEGKRAATISSFTDAAAWFTFHTDESEHDEHDSRALESLWARMHAALPELGAGAEVLETSTPRTTYERTRRRLGMVGGVGQAVSVFGPQALTHRTPVPNLFMVGDTIFPGNGVAAVTQSALVVADEIAPPRRGR